nr:hypothetical protein Ade03nite_81170 [Actinoplanes derwentensis]
MTEHSPMSNTSLPLVGEGWIARSWLSPERRDRDQLGGRSAHAGRPPSPANSGFNVVPAASEIAHPVADGNREQRPPARHPLCGMLFCRCGARFYRSESPGARREYMTVCGCRLRPIDADTIERQVAATRNMLHAIPAAAGQSGPQTFTAIDGPGRIEVGGTLDDIRFVPRP